MSKKVLLLVPAYNESENIVKTINDIKKNGNYDYIIINDCSKDTTKEVCEKNNFKFLDLPINFGLTSGIQLGMKFAKNYNYDIVIQIDGDGQHKVEYINNIIDKMEVSKSNIVIGSRFINNKKPITFRMLGSNLISFVLLLTTKKIIKDPTSGMRAYDKKCINEFVNNDSLTPEPDTLVYFLKKSYKVSEVQVEMRDREFGESYLNPIKSLEYMIKIIFSIIFVRFLTRGKKGDK